MNKLEAELGGHRDHAMVESVSLNALQNISSAQLEPSVIDKYLLNKLKKGRIASSSTPSVSNLHINRFGVIHKNQQLGKWCLILDLSSPAGVSVNDGIPKDTFTVQYMSVDDVIEGIMAY